MTAAPSSTPAAPTACRTRADLLQARERELGRSGADHHGPGRTPVRRLSKLPAAHVRLLPGVGRPETARRLLRGEVLEDRVQDSSTGRASEKPTASKSRSYANAAS